MTDRKAGGGDGSPSGAEGSDVETEKARLREKRKEEAEERKAFERHLRRSCKDGTVESVGRLLDARVSPTGANSSGTTPLHEASYSGNTQVCELLLARGASANETDCWNGSALHHAAGEGKQDVVELLIRHKADVNAMNKTQRMPLDLAQRNGHKKVADVLVAEAMRFAEVKRRETQKSCAIGTVVFAALAFTVSVSLYVGGYLSQDPAWLRDAHETAL
eukprot:TRINITY_DN63047_c0_g1_i1.p1 TRINITY_DN63047_c0_g1~~TRINITY_DN63047_c0_g1_i1.p1  ORF type:complete len:256 (+),score=43.32 TRINITY_DN63047_c0_g1_i1:113-769(+)